MLPRIRIGQHADNAITAETSSCQAVQILLDDEEKTSITVVDTPGFDDSGGVDNPNRTDGEIFTSITEFLTAQYALQVPLKGILYLHKISDNRMTGSSQRYLGMLRKICGDHAFKNVVLVTTMWGLVRPEHEGVVLRREQELIGKYWQPMIDRGSSVSQFTGSTDSAFALIWELAGRNNIVLDIQRQLVDEGLRVRETAAGQQLSQKLHDDEVRYKEIVRHLEYKIADCEESGDREGEKKAALEKRTADNMLLQIRKSQDRMGLQTGRNMKQKIKDRMQGKALTTTITVFTAVLSITLTLVKFLAT